MIAFSYKKLKNSNLIGNKKEGNKDEKDNER